MARGLLSAFMGKIAGDESGAEEKEDEEEKEYEEEEEDEEERSTRGQMKKGAGE